MPFKDPEKRRAYQKARRERDRERDAMRYATDPAFRARKIASSKKYYEKNRKKRDVVEPLQEVLREAVTERVRVDDRIRDIEPPRVLLKLPRDA